MAGILSSHDPNDTCGPFTFKVWIETEEINDENDHYERGSEPMDVVAGLASQEEADEAVQLLEGAPALAQKAARMFGEVVDALEGEIASTECLTKYGDDCEEDELCEVCAHANTTDGTSEIIDALRKLGDLAGPEEGFEGDE